MRYVKTLSVVFAVALLVLAPRTARADAYNQSMIFTFSGPVAIPGVVLPAGTYQFKLADPGTEANVVQILSDDGSQVYATLPDSAKEPPKRLVAWTKVNLKPGESREVKVEIDLQFLQIFDEAANSWKQVPGQYTFAVGGSSKELSLKQQVTLP